MTYRSRRFIVLACFVALASFYPLVAREPDSSGQRLAAHAGRLVDALEALGSPLDETLRVKLEAARRSESAVELERLLDSVCFGVVTISPESRVKVEPGAVRPTLQQAGYVPWIVKIVNQAAVTAPLQVTSPQAGPSYAGVALLSMQRQDQLELRSNEPKPADPRRFLDFEWYESPPMSRLLSGAPLEYAILLVYSSDAGSREAQLEFSVGSGTQDLGFRALLPLAVTAQPALPVRLRIADEDGAPAFARLTIRDAHGRIYPPQPRRLAPDFFFQQQIYRADGESVLLPPGEFTVESSQGPETIVVKQSLSVNREGDNLWQFRLRRWVHPMRFGWYCGDHHIHGAGCAHYTSPTEGVTPQDMFRQVAGEGLNVGCVLTWGPCFEHQRQFFRPDVDAVSRPKTLLKYDIEISGFGSQALGHVCLLNLRDQEYPGSDGTKEKGWPTWATPALRWAKAQGAITGFAHSASGLQIDPQRAAARLLTAIDADGSGLVSAAEATDALLPDDFSTIDSDRDRGLSSTELQVAIDRAADRLPNLAIPEMNSVGAMELPVAVTVGACDFISTMDTARIAEWNMWYHVLNCGFPLKASGETDFPCMSGNAVGQGRVYVSLGDVRQIDFGQWCQRLAEGRSYVSDGYAHALEFEVEHDGRIARSGDRLELAEKGEVTVRARVSLAPQMPRAVAYGTRHAEGGKRFIGDTVTLHGSRSVDWVEPGTRTLELVLNGLPLVAREISASGNETVVEFQARVDRSSWLAVRCFPHLHTNPVEVIVGGQPIRASAASARWCAAVIRQLWTQREKNIAAAEREAAHATFTQAIAEYERRAQDAASR